MTPELEARKLANAVKTLTLDVAAAEVCAAFKTAGIESILLKGRSFAVWLYESDGDRSYDDVDILVNPLMEREAGAVLTALGYREVMAGSGFGEGEGHASPWIHEERKCTIDLHRTLAGVRISPDRCWQILRDHTSPLRVAGESVLQLDEPARALHLALHLLDSWPGKAAVEEDLRRALLRAGDPAWLAAAVLARELGCVAAFRAALGTQPEGGRLIEVLPSVGLGTADRLRLAGRPATALSFATLAETRDWPERARYVMRRLWPSKAYLRRWEPEANRGVVARARARTRVVLGSLRKAPSGYRAWRRADRDARSR